jgi:hypothetical protein
MELTSDIKLAEQPIESCSGKDKVILLLVRDLLSLGWHFQTQNHNSFELIPPTSYSKDIIKKSMIFSRNERIKRDQKWIAEHLTEAQKNIASGEEVLNSAIQPRIEVCETEKQHNLFRILRYTWSSPSSDYVGRRIRILLRDDAIPGSPIIGIAALGSSIIHIPQRDKYIGWDIKTRTDKIASIMDAYVIGAMPPYSYLLGGKLVSYSLASNELRKIFKDKYCNAETIIKKRKISDLALIMTTSLYGKHSSQYNRLNFGNQPLYRNIGMTAGYGSLHISNETFKEMFKLVIENGLKVNNKFGDGPNWRMRVVRSACDLLGLDSDLILKHSFPRGLYLVPLASNWRKYLQGKNDILHYRNLPLDTLSQYWHERWFEMRKKNTEIIKEVRAFTPDQFSVKEI